MKNKKILVVGAGLALTSAIRGLNLKDKDIIIVEDSSPPWDIVINGKTYKKIQEKKNPNYLTPYKYDDEAPSKTYYTEEQIIKEFELIGNKKSHLSRRQRDSIITEFFKLYKLI